MNFIEAVKEMKEGKKVRRKYWNKSDYYYINESKVLVNELHYKPNRLIHNIEAIDWEIVEEPKKTLSSKVLEGSKYSDTGIWRYKEEDVKQALEEFLNWIEIKPRYFVEIKQKVKEIFGKRLSK